MAPKRHGDTSILDDAMPSKKLKTKQKFRFPSQDKMHSDPELKALNKKINKDPVYRRMMKQMKYLLGDSTAHKFDGQVYSSAAKQFLKNKELVDDVKRIRDAVMQDPSNPGGEERIHAKFAPAFSAILEEIKNGGPDVRERYLTEPDSFRKFAEAIKLTVEGGTTSSDDITSLNEVEKPAGGKEFTVDQNLHGDTEVGLKNAPGSGIFDVKLYLAGLYRDGDDRLVKAATANVKDPIHKAWIEYGVAVGAHESPLHLAAFSGRKRSVEVLLEDGADALLENFRGYLPIELAEFSGSCDVVKLLEEHINSQIDV